MVLKPSRCKRCFARSTPLSEVNGPTCTRYRRSACEVTKTTENPLPLNRLSSASASCFLLRAATWRWTVGPCRNCSSGTSARPGLQPGRGIPSSPAPAGNSTRRPEGQKPPGHSSGQQRQPERGRCSLLERASRLLQPVQYSLSCSSPRCSRERRIPRTRRPRRRR